MWWGNMGYKDLQNFEPIGWHGLALEAENHPKFYKISQFAANTFIIHGKL